MKKILLTGFSILIVLSAFSQNWVEMMRDSNENFYTLKKAFNNYWDGKKIGKGKGWKQFKRWEHFMEPRVYPDGDLNHGADLWLAYQDLKKNDVLKTNDVASWTSLGPTTIPTNGGGAGRINCIAFYSVHPNLLYAGSPSGGLWKSTDGGSNWTTNTDLLPNIGVSSIVIHPSNPDIMYIATGDGDATDTYTIGVLKSTDGGQTWNATGLQYNVSSRKCIRKLIIHPTNPDTLFAATNAGIFRTIDAGSSWTNVRSGNFYDLEFKPDDPSIIWAASYNRVWKSTDSGNTFLACSAFTPYDINRLSIAVTQDDPDYLYILGGNSTDNGFAGVWRTTDLGTTFTLCADSPNLLGWETDGSDAGGQGWYDLSLAVSPTDKNIVFVGGVNIWKSVNGGTTWTLNAHWYGGGGKPYVHADIHTLEFLPGNGNTLYAGCDGGVFISSNTGNSWADKSSSLSIGQLYRLGCSATNKDLIMTGWQDNGSNLFNSSSWSQVLGGDGMECLIDYSSPNIMYGEYYYGYILRSNDGGDHWSSITDDISEEGDWITPFCQDPVFPQTIYAGFENLYRSDNRGDTWTQLTDFSGTSKITAIAIAPSNTQNIYICLGSYVHKSIDGGVNFTNISSGLPSLSPTSIAVSPVDPEVLWVTFSGYSEGNKVFESRNGGSSWTNISGSLPNIPANTIVMETATDEGLYVGTDLGVFYRDSIIGDWTFFNSGLPNVIVDELEIHYGSGKLRAATYGRGLWETDLYSIAGTGNDFVSSENNLKVYPNPADDIVNIEIPDLYGNESAELIVINNIGSVVYNKNISSSDECLSIDMSNKPAGLYVIKIMTLQHNFSGTFLKN